MATTSNLPEPPFAGVMTMSTSVEIDAPIEQVWDILLDFPAYKDWNTFVVSQTIVSKDRKPAESQVPAEGLYLLMETHIPPSSSTAQGAFEQITHIDAAAHRLAWRSLQPPPWFVRAERWQALSTTAPGRTLYESRETFGGVGAYAIRAFLSGKLQLSFDAMAKDLKQRAETLSAPVLA